MKRLILIMFLMVSCSDNHESISDEELLKKGEDFCSCHKGLWYAAKVGSSGIVEIKCNDGAYDTMDEHAIIKRVCE